MAENIVVGEGSPAGKRWFYSKYSELVLEVEPQRYPNERGETIPFIRVPFEKQLKPAIMQGDGKLGSRNKSGTDMNASQWYGVLVIEDPGQSPKTEAEKKNRRIIDHIRNLDHYKKTPQDNCMLVTARLKELNWDPREAGDGYNGMVVPGGHRPLKRPAFAGAPEEGRIDPPIAKPSPMGRRAAA